MPLAAVSLAQPGLSLPVAGAVLLAAVAHAAWNSIAHRITDKLVAFALLGVGSVVGAVPLLLLAPAPDPRSWPYLGASAALHVAYDLLLMRAYRLGDFSQMYPIARGTSPLVVTVLSAVFVGEVPSLGQTAGVVCISAGLASLMLLGRGNRPVHRPAVLAAVATGLAIATYSTVDGVGIRLADSPLGYTGWLMLLHDVVLPLAALAVRGRALAGQVRPVWHLGIAGGLISMLAYGLVLWAQTRAALATVAALRETSIIFGALIGTVFFHERFGRARIVAAVLVAAGIVVLNLP